MAQKEIAVKAVQKYLCENGVEKRASGLCAVLLIDDMRSKVSKDGRDLLEKKAFWNKIKTTWKGFTPEQQNSMLLAAGGALTGGLFGGFANGGKGMVAGGLLGLGAGGLMGMYKPDWMPDARKHFNDYFELG
jgi:hypothetical protein